MTIMMRRFTIICLAFALFALGMTEVVNNHARNRLDIGQFGVSNSCHQPQGPGCTIHN